MFLVKSDYNVCYYLMDEKTGKVQFRVLGCYDEFNMNSEYIS